MHKSVSTFALTSALLLLACLALAGCGKSNQSDASGISLSASAAKPDDGLPKLRCPARIKSKAEGPDIGGFRLGLTRDEALNLARCDQKDAVVADEDRFFAQLQTGSMKLGPQMFTVQSGETGPCKFTSMADMDACGVGNRVWKRVDESVTIAAPGLPGRETVVGVWRTQNYQSGDAPAIDTVQTALIKKYGPPQLRQQGDGDNGWVQLFWMQDPAGQPISEQNPLINRCGSIRARGNQDQSWSEACGLSITAMLFRSPGNPLLARELSVGMVDQARLFAFGSALQDEIVALEKQRQQGELQQANETAGAPKL